MPLFRIYKLKENLRQHFRQIPHTSGEVTIKPKDYELADSIEAVNPYSVWALRKQAGAPLLVGDVLEQESSGLQIYKFIGFEPAQWWVPEPKLVEIVPAEESILAAGEKV